MNEKKKLLENYIGVADLKRFKQKELINLCAEVRELIIQLATKKEIHLSSNLGIVEISLAILLNFDLLNDTVIYDTGHQTYVHKILTDRKEKIHTIREDNGLSGLLDLNESKYDHYSPGHSGNTLSVLSGMYEAEINKTNKYYLAVIGDASIATGLSFTALLDIAYKKLPLIIVLNDNKMSISQPVGSLSDSFNKLTKNPEENNFFKSLGYQYLGVYDGNDLKVVNHAFRRAKTLVKKGPIIIHFRTTKGKGLLLAERDVIGNYHSNSLKHKISFGDVSYKVLRDEMNTNQSIRILNPAMSLGTGFNQMLLDKEKYYQDLGISEEHTVSKASGMLLKNRDLNVICLFYSTFLQRAYDQLVHDVSRFNLNLTFLLDRADLSGGDGSSHHGIFDVGFLKTFPNVTITSPRNFKQLEQLIKLSFLKRENIFVIRYPKAPFVNETTKENYKIRNKSWETLISKNNKTLILTYGPYTDFLYKKIRENKLPVDLICATFITNYSENYLEQICSKYENIICYERIYGELGLLHDLSKYVAKYHLKVNIIGMHYTDFVGNGSTPFLDKAKGMDFETIKKVILKLSQ